METLVDKFYRLKKERNAILLAHYYQDAEVQDVADFLGDSLALAQAAKKAQSDVIVFAGVHFMAETAKILNPSKLVLLPDMNAGCSLADSAPEKEFREWKQNHPDHIVISYINCSTQVKAMSDIICTSSNAERIINSIPADRKICFAPDKYLGAHLIKKTGRDLVLWDGSCQVHTVFSELSVINMMKNYPSALVLAHPECPENILHYADYIGSTTGILKYAEQSDANEFIIATEPGIIHQMEKSVPNKKFYPVPNLDGCSCNECPHMRLITLEKIVNSLETLSPEITMPEELRLKALKPIEKMLELS
jgi:quinolinate synthase